MRRRNLTSLIVAAMLAGTGCAANPNINLTPQRRAEIQAMPQPEARNLGYTLAIEDAQSGKTHRTVMSSIWHGAGALAGPVGYGVAWWLYPEGVNMRVESDLHPTLKEYADGYRIGLDQQARKADLKGKLIGGAVGTALLLTAFAVAGGS
jgi:hypothetical protein